MNADIRVFLQGELQAQYLLEVLARAGANVGEFRAVLDFGCGPGRVIRQFRHLRKKLIPHAKIYGTDINLASVNWCRRNLTFAEFAENQGWPPLPYDDEQFDFIYAFSVFTHLTKKQQNAWIHELARILKPGGHLLITVHGESFLYQLTPAELVKFKAGELVVKGEEHAGFAAAYGQCAAYHPPGYVEHNLAKGFELIKWVPVGALKPGPHGSMDQDQYFLRKLEVG